MSLKARKIAAQQRELQQLFESQDWREERDNDTEEVPEPEPERLVNTFH